ncbi:MAG: TonB-dependent siderophore receptor [Nostoc sp.]|uniref:TonB-dependent siderophore receptor n=1 Tax=Nostoc sp. TaxID=1180 RepID=UPI002FF6A689
MSKQVCKFSYGVEWLLILSTVLLLQPAKAQEIPKSDHRLSDRLAKTLPQAKPPEATKKIRQLSELEPVVTSAKMLLVQSSTPPNTPQIEVVQVTAVKANPTSSGVEVILQTTKGEQLQVTNRSTGNNFIADIPNAQLRLPSGDAFTFRSPKPISGITEIRVTNFDANTIRVTVTGEGSIPTVELFDSPNEGIIFAVASAAPSTPSEQQPQTPQQPEQEQPGSQTQPSQPSAQQGDEPIELVVTGEQDGYRVPNATTATKTDTPVHDIPQSIQVIPQQVIKDQGVTRTFDALRNVSSIAKEGGYGDSQDNYRIRGFVTYDSLRNGFRISSPITNPTSLERIEVLKGPASVLYGQFEPGGIVNFVTKQPLDYPYYSGEFTVGSYDYYRPSIDVSGPLTTDKKLLYRLNVAYETTGDFVDFVNSKTFSIAPVLTYKFSDATTLTLEYQYLSTDRVYNDGLPPNPIVFQLPISRFLGEPDINSFRQDANNLNVTFAHRFSDNLQLRSGFAAYFSDERVRSIRPGADLDVDGRTIPRGFVPSDRIINSAYTFQTDLIGKFNTGSIKHQVLLGFAWDQYNYKDPAYFQTDGSPIDIFNPVYGSPQPTDVPYSFYKEGFDEFGIYLQDQITLLPNLKLLLGGRVDFIHSSSFSQNFDSAGTATDNPTETRFYNNPFTPRVGVVYQPIEPISVYFSYAQSFKPNSSRTVDGSALPPESGTQYEVGVKAELIKDRLSATFAAYDITKENVATTDPTPGNSDYSIAAGEVKSRGLEFDVSGQILPGWNVIASAFINDAFVSKDNSLPVGDSLVNAPGSGASLWTTYEIQIGDWKGFGFGGGVFYTGDREAELPNTFKIPSYVRADASIFYKRDNWKVGLNFKNLFDTTYYDSQGYYLRPGAPLTVLGTFSVQF